MSFRWTKNLGLISLLAVLLLFTLLAQYESELFNSAIDDISMAHNPRHHDAVRMIQLLNSADVELEIYRKRDITTTDDIATLFNTAQLHKDELIELFNYQPTGNLAVLEHTIVTLNSTWKEYLYLWKSGEDPNSETLQAYFQLMLQKCETALRIVNRIHQGHNHQNIHITDYALRPMETALDSAIEKMESLNQQVPIDIEDILNPVKSLYQIVLKGPSASHSAGSASKPSQSDEKISSAGYSPDLVQSVSRLSDTVDTMFATRSDSGGSLHQQYIISANTQIKALELDLQKLFEGTKTEIDQTVSALESRLSLLRNIRQSTTLLGILLAALISIVLSRALTKHLANVTKGTQLLASGNLNYRIPVTQKDELGLLSHSFNQMADKLSAREIEREKLIDTLDVTAKRADMANVAKSDFMASMSHEIRTPINGVLGTTDLLLREPLSRSQKHLVETIHRSGYSLLGIINDILDFSKIEAGGMQLDPSPFSLLLLAEDVAEMGAPAAHDKGLELNCIIQPDTREFVIGDALRLRQVLTNLVSNAIKFTETGEVVISVSSQQIDEHSVSYIIAVKDTGIGIAEFMLDEIFSPFSQADRSTTRRYGGTGLGLSITVQLLELMNGELTVESTPGEGSTFTVFVTLETDQQTVDNKIMPDFQEPMHALLLSPNGSTREALQFKLESLGITSKTFSSGGRAILEIEENIEQGKIPYNLMFIDHSLTDMGCLEFLEGLKSISEKTDAIDKIALCLAGENELLDKARNELGLSIRLVKPIRQSALFNTLLEIQGETTEAKVDSVAQVIEESLNGRVLLVEDHPINQDIVTRMLRLIGCEVELACDGQIAVDRLLTESFDVVLMDCDMPVLDGFDATRTIRQNEAKSAGTQRQVIIALTANALQGDRNRCIEAGMDDYMPKPVDLKSLRSKLSCWIKPLGQQQKTPTLDSAASLATSKHSNFSSTEPETEALPEILDLPVVDELVKMGDDDPNGFLQSLITDFSVNFTADHQKLLAEVDSANAEQCRKLAHRLKSSSATIGAARLAAACGEIERLAKSGQLESLQQLVESLPAEQQLALEAISGITRKAA